MSETLAQTYVWHDGKCFFVSTINKDCADCTSSSTTEPVQSMHAETMAWECDPETGARLKFIGQDKSSEGSLQTHCQMVEQLSKLGFIEQRINQ